MLNRTILFSVIAAAGCVLLLFGTAPSVDAADKNTFLQIDKVFVLGQNQNDSRRTPSFGEQFRRFINRILPDDEFDENPNQRQAQQQPVVALPAIPVQPPRAPTAADVRQSATVVADQTPQRTRGTTSVRDATDGKNGTDVPLHVRLQRMREGVFSHPEVERAAQTSRQSTQRASTPRNDAAAGDVWDIADFPAISRTQPTLQPAADDIEVFVPLNQRQQTIPRSDHPVAERSAPAVAERNAPTTDRFAPSQQPAQRLVMETEQRRETSQEPSRQSFVSMSPRLEIEIENPPNAVVGQEIAYRIRATNVGNVPAEQVVLNVEIPPWIEIRHTDADNGNWVLLPRSDGSGIADMEWRVNRINQGETNLLALWLVPQLHRTIELPIQYNFHRPAIVAKVEVQEPRLLMELVGPEEVRWNDFVVYTLIVRNVGTGRAENLRFELLQSSSSDARRTSMMDYPLLPGEGQEIPIEVQAGRDQEQLDIAVVATGAHELRSEVRRRVRVLRPKLEMSVQTSPLHFVDEAAEIFIRVVNNGDADAENVVIRAELPLGAQHVTNSEGGLFVQQNQQNIVEWRGRSIGRGEIQTFSLACIPRREGECRVSVEARESNGSLLVAGNGTFMAEAIVELDLVVHRPNGPIELGQEVTYTIEVTNTGTKAAENVEISMMFGEQLEPTGVGGRDAHHTANGQVLFEKIPAILPRQNVTLRVHVEARGVGTAQIRAEVVRSDPNGPDVRLEQGLSAHIFSTRQRGTTTAEQSIQNETFR